ASATTNSRTADLPIVVPSEVAGIVKPKLPKFVPCLTRARKPLKHFQPSPKEAGRTARPKDNAIISYSWPAFGGRAFKQPGAVVPITFLPGSSIQRWGRVSFSARGAADEAARVHRSDGRRGGLARSRPRRPE